MPVDKGRLHKELADVQRDKGSGVTVEILDDQLSHLRGTLKGAPRAPSRRRARASLPGAGGGA